MATTATRWNLVISKETDTGLRQFLASEGGGRKGDLSKFVEEAVKARIFQVRVGRIKARNSRVSADELDLAIDQAVSEVRQEKAARRRKV
jgi:hypothetical protein